MGLSQQPGEAEHRDPDATQSPHENAPDWITPELVQKTLETWQPYYSYQLTYRDAIAMIQHVGSLLEVLSREAGK